MFGLGTLEIILIILAIILLFGAKKIPELARGIGRSINEFKKGVRNTENEAEDKKKLKSKKS